MIDMNDMNDASGESKQNGTRVTEAVPATLSAALRQDGVKKRWKDIADNTGISEATIRQYASPSNPLRPSLENLALLARELDLSTDYLIFGVSDKARRDEVYTRTQEDRHLKSILQLQRYQENQSLQFGRIMQALANNLDDTVRRAMEKAALPVAVYSGLIDNYEAMLLELNSIETKIYTMNLQADLALSGIPKDGDIDVVKILRENNLGGFVASSFLPIVAHNLRNDRKYQFIVANNGIDGLFNLREMIENYRYELSLFYSPISSDGNCEFKMSYNPLNSGMVLMKLDVITLEKENPVLLQRIAKYRSASGWIGYIIPPSHEQTCGLLMDEDYVEKALQAFNKNWSMSKTLDKKARQSKDNEGQ